MIKIFEEIDHYSLFLGHVSAACVATFGMLRSFATTPNFVYCSGFDPCSCAEFFIPLYFDYCGPSIGSNETLSENVQDIEVVNQETDSDTASLIIPIIAVATLFAIFFGGGIVIKTLDSRRRENEFQEMKEQLERQQISEEKMAMVLNVLGVNDYDMNDQGSSKRIQGVKRVISNKFQNLLEDLGRVATRQSELGLRGDDPKVDEPRDASVTFVDMPRDESKKEESEESELISSTKKEPAQNIEEDDISEGESEDSLQSTSSFGDGEEDHEIYLGVIQSLQIPSDEIEIINYGIARGAFGEIHKAMYKGKFIAAKTLLTLDEESVTLFRHEIILSAQLQHPNIVLLIGASWDRGMIALVLEFAEGGSLDTALKKNFHSGTNVEGTWSWHDPMLKIAIDIASALTYLHHTRFYDDISKSHKDTILHRDMKPGNVLLTSTLSAKVSDFGTSKALDVSTEQTMVGTPLFMAPEIHLGMNYDHAADVFSFGITLWSMSVGHENLFKRMMKDFRGTARPRRANAANIVMNAVAHDNLRPSLMEECHRGMPNSLKELIRSCWVENKR